MNRKEEGDFYYDVWRSGGNPDRIDFERYSEREYDWISDTGMVREELRRQHPPQEQQEQEDYPREQYPEQIEFQAAYEAGVKSNKGEVK